MTDAELVREIAQPLSGGSDDYDALLALVGNARFVLIGEATHGTYEFYSERATITKRLRKASPSWPLRRIGRIQPAFIVTCATTLRPTPIKRFRVFAGSLRGCGATPS